MTQKELTCQYEVELHKQINKLCHRLELPLHYNRKGPKIFTNYQRVALIILYVRSKKSLVDFLTEFVETRWPSWLDLKEIPGKSTLNDWIKQFDLSFIRAFLKEQVADQNPEVMAIDATGLDSWQRSRHYERRIKQCGVREEYMPYAKADVLVDTNTLLIHDWVLRIKPRHDVLGAATILKRMKKRGILILADKGYDSEPLHELAVRLGNLLFAPVRNKRKVPRGFNRRRCAKGNELYPMRNTVESAIHAIKSVRRELRSRLANHKKREFGWTVILFNMRRIIKDLGCIIKLILHQLIPDAPFLAVSRCDGDIPPTPDAHAPAGTILDTAARNSSAYEQGVDS